MVSLSEKGKEELMELTEGELRLLERVSQGSTVRGAALELHFSEATAKRYMTSVRDKLGALSNAHAVALAYGEELLPLGSSPSRLKQCLMDLGEVLANYLH